MARSATLKTESESTVLVENKPTNGLNLSHLATLPNEFYQYSPYTSNLERCDLSKMTFKSLRNKDNEINFVVAVFNPLTVLLDDNKEKVDLPFNKPQVITLPLSSFKSSLASVVKGFFQFQKSITDKQTGESVGERSFNYFQITTTFELFAFAYCLTVEDVIEPIKERSRSTESNATIRKYATEVVNAIKNIVIGTCQIPISSVLHIPFFHEQNNGGAPIQITEKSLKEAYQNILNR